MKTPRSPYEKLGGLFFFGRSIDKIRLKAKGELRADFYEMMGSGFDARLMNFLGLKYAAFAEYVQAGHTDTEIAEWAFTNGRRLNDDEILIWNDFSSKRGWNDSASERLAQFKRESGCGDRTDLITLFQYMEVDEGRKP